MTVSAPSFLGVALILTGITSYSASGQSNASLQGVATNLGFGGGTPLPAEIGIQIEDPIDGFGQLVVQPPLGGSGSARAWAWGDTLALLSISSAGDTIIWLGGTSEGAPSSGNQAFLGPRFHQATQDLGIKGRYWITGGSWRGQMGEWAAWVVDGALAPKGYRPTSIATVGFHVLSAMQAGPPASTTPSITSTPADGMATSGFFLILVGVVGIVAGFTKMRQSPSARHTNSRAHESGTPPPRENPGTVGSVGNVEKSQYNVSCPHCQSARVVGAKKLYFMYGFLLAAQYGSRVEVGCDGCLSRRVGAQLLKNLCFGWWSVPWGVLTPIVVLTNAWQWLAAPNESFTEEVLAKAGIDPEATRVGPDGLSGEQRRLIDPAVEMLRRAIHADAVVSPHEIQVAEEILTSLTGGVADTAGLRSRLLSTDEAPLDASILPADYRLLLLDAALDVVLADGHLAEEELRFLSSAVWFLQLPNAALEGALARRLGWTGGNRRGDAANARNAASDLTRALTVLGLQIGASWHQIRQAYRRAMLQYHPDRAGRHKQRQAEYTKRAQEINWAYKVCEAHYAAS